MYQLPNDPNDIMKYYHVNDRDLITDPGKFERCHVSTVFFHMLVMDGLWDDTVSDVTGQIYDVFFVDENDRMVWRLSDDTYAVVIFTNTYGFVRTYWLSDAQYRQWMDAIEREFDELNTFDLD